MVGAVKIMLLLCTLALTSTAFALDPDAIADTIDGLVAELFMHDANSSFEQGNHKDAHDKFLWLAERGNPAAQHRLGMIYEEGLGVPQDYTIAFTWYQRAAQQGHAQAQHQIGRIYYYGRNVPQDYIRAYAWLYAAAAQGSEAGRKSRDRVAEVMTPEQVMVARELGQQWVQKYNQKQ